MQNTNKRDHYGKRPNNLDYLRKILGNEPIKAYLNIERAKNRKKGTDKFQENDKKCYEVVRKLLSYMGKFGRNRWWLNEDETDFMRRITDEDLIGKIRKIKSIVHEPELPFN